MAIYFDTSLLVSPFVLEPVSPRVATFAATVGQPIFFSDFQRAELVTALHCKEGRKDITAADVAKAMKDVQTELRQGALAWREPTWKSVFALTARPFRRARCQDALPDPGCDPRGARSHAGNQGVRHARPPAGSSGHGSGAESAEAVVCSG